MRIQINSSGIGSKTFLRRMKTYMLEHYDDVQFVEDHPDIYLSSPWRGKPPKGCKSIHRADGVYFDTLLSGKTGMNKRIAEAINKANAVIYQSNHAKKMCNGILKIKQKTDTVIYNGADPISSDVKIDKMGFDTMLVACAKWRPLKRPISIAKGFLEASLANAVLVMIGDIDSKYKIKHSNIKYVGQVSSKDTLGYYASCDGVIHISRMDACPNVVVEALSAGKPVLGNNVGGTPELIKDDGVIINIDPPYNYKMFAMKNPDSVKPTYVSEGIHKLLGNNWNIDREDLTIGYSAKKYYEYFKQVLSC